MPRSQRAGCAGLLILLTVSCSPAPQEQSPPVRPEAPAPSGNATRTPPAAAPGPAHLNIRGAAFEKSGERFEWRGITAFRLAEMIAHGREHEAVAFLDWAARQKLTVVRVLLMAQHLFQLEPEEGRTALPRLLELAGARNLHVEAVLLADTKATDLDQQHHVKAAGEIAAAYGNALIEIANEPWHATQDVRLHDPTLVKKLAALVPATVPVALGSAERNTGYSAGRYATWHSPRASGQEGWGHVLALADGAKLVADWGKPVISDEPIGAADALVPGRRDNEPARFGAAAALSRLAGLGATFHYEGGLQARLPTAREAAALAEWSAALDLLRDLPDGGTFLAGPELSRVAIVRNARAAFGRLTGTALWLLAIDPGPNASIEFLEGWQLERPERRRGYLLYRARR